MHFKLSTWFALIGLLSLFVLRAPAQTPGAAPGTKIEGTIVAKRVVGEVQFRDIAGTMDWAPLANDQVIKQKSVVRTGQNSSVVLVFSNGASINLAYESVLNIEEFTQDPFDTALSVANAESEPSNSRTNLMLTRGELVGNVKKLKDASSQFRVGTPVGAAGIRGTTFRIVYRPTGNGQAFNFMMTTLEGNVEVVVGSGTVSVPPVQVTDNQQVVIADVEVNTVTNQLTITSPAGQTVVIDAPPPVVQAPPAVVQQMQANAQTIAAAVAAVVFNAPVTQTSSPTPTTNPQTQNQQNQENQNQQGQGQQQNQGNQQGQGNSNNPNQPNQNPSNSPGSSSNPSRLTNPGGTP